VVLSSKTISNAQHFCDYFSKIIKNVAYILAQYHGQWRRVIGARGPGPPKNVGMEFYILRKKFKKKKT